MPNTRFLLWCDLETTGTDENLDEILEAAFLFTDVSNPDVLVDAHVPINVLFPLSVDGRDRLDGNDYVAKMHADNGLLDDLNLAYGPPRSKPAREAAVEYALQPVIEALRAIGAKPHQVMLAGSGVSHFDRRFIDAQFPGLAAWLSYPSLDVGSWRRGLEFFLPAAVSDANDGKTHRAMDDVLLHRRELADYINQLALLQDTPR